jgi:hypothetical protein
MTCENPPTTTYMLKFGHIKNFATNEAFLKILNLIWWLSFIILHLVSSYLIFNTSAFKCTVTASAFRTLQKLPILIYYRKFQESIVTCDIDAVEYAACGGSVILPTVIDDVFLPMLNVNKIRRSWEEKN